MEWPGDGDPIFPLLSPSRDKGHLNTGLSDTSGVAGWAGEDSADTNSSRRSCSFSSLKLCKVGHNEIPSSPPSQEEFNAASQPIQNTPGSNLYEATKKINPKTKSYSGGEEGKEVAPKISMRTFPLTPAVAWGSPLRWDRAGDVSSSFCTFLLLGEAPKCRVLGVLGWDHEDLGAGEGTALGGNCPAGKRAPKEHGPLLCPICLVAVRVPGVTLGLLEVVLLLAVIQGQLDRSPHPQNNLGVLNCSHVGLKLWEGMERIVSCRREWELNQSHLKSRGVGRDTHKVPLPAGHLIPEGE